MSTKAEIVTVRCGNGACCATADVTTVGADETGVQWNTVPAGWFERLGRKEPFGPRMFVCSRSCLLAVLTGEQQPFVEELLRHEERS